MSNRGLFIAFFAVAVLLTSVLSVSLPFADAHPHSGTTQAESHTHQPETEFIPINGVIGIEKTTVFFTASPDNTLPWGFVEGKIGNHVPNYPVIIQIYDDNGDATHFAQTDVQEDGSYEYKFRVRNVDNGEVINVFEGDYLVKIFKVVYSNDSNLV